MTSTISPWTGTTEFGAPGVLLDRPAPGGLDLADIEERLRDPDPAVRVAVITLLAETAPSGAGDTLAWALADEDEVVRVAAAAALDTSAEISFGEDGVDALLLAAVRGRDERVRTTAAALLDVLARGARELYARGLRDGDAQVRVQAVRGLAALQDTGAVARAAGDPAREVRSAVADGLTRSVSAAPSDTLLALERLLADQDVTVRMAALDAAAVLGMPEPLARRALASLAHSHWQVRKRAAHALGEADAETAVRPLIRALRDRTVDVRRAAVQSLEQWTAGHPEVILALTEALTDSDPGVRTQVRWALA